MDIHSIPNPPEDVDGMLHLMTMATEIGVISGMGIWTCVPGGTLWGKIISSGTFKDLYFDLANVSQTDPETGKVTTKPFREYLKSTSEDA